jgi:peptide deformylase
MNLVADIDALRQYCDFVPPGQPVSELVALMFEELAQHDALGLAAPQVGELLRVIVMEMQPAPPICILNPVIQRTRGRQRSVERCLSLPGIEVALERPRQVVVTGWNQEYRPVRYRFRRLRAAVACHEIDHLNGVLLLDYQHGQKVAQI